MMFKVGYKNIIQNLEDIYALSFLFLDFSINFFCFLRLKMLRFEFGFNVLVHTVFLIVHIPF